MKIFKIIIINVLLLILVLLVSEFLYFQKLRIDRYDHSLPFLYKEKDILKIFGEYPSDRFKPYDETFVSNKEPVLFLGCSYTYGQHLKDYQTLPELVKKLSNRWTYNFGMSGTGPMYTYLLLKQEKKHPLIKKHKPKYIIYTYMFHHIDRWCMWCYYNIYRKEHFVDEKFNFLYNFYLYSSHKNSDFDAKICEDHKSIEKRIELLVKIMGKIKESCDSLFPDNKFIFLIYSDINKDLNEDLTTFYTNKKEMEDFFNIMYSGRLKKEMEKLGFTVITTEELIGRKMDRKGDRVPSTIDNAHPHPSAKAWQEIAPKLVKKLNL